jgi:hypothetical protein
MDAQASRSERTLGAAMGVGLCSVRNRGLVTDGRLGGSVRGAAHVMLCAVARLVLNMCGFG